MQFPTNDTLQKLFVSIKSKHVPGQKHRLRWKFHRGSEYALALHKRLASYISGNLVYSPTTITGSQPLVTGAAGETRDEITNTLEITDFTGSLTNVAQQLLNFLAGLRGYNGRLLIANSLSLGPEFRRLAVQGFHAKQISVNFNEPGCARKELTHWLNNQIPGLLKLKYLTGFNYSTNTSRNNQHLLFKGELG